MSTFGYNPILNAMAERNRQFDGIKEAVEQVQFDPISERQALVETANMRMAAVSILLTLAMIVSEEQDIDEQELLPSEVLDGLIIEAFDNDDDDDVDDTVRLILSAHVADCMSSLGVDKGLIDDAFGLDVDLADEAIEKVCQVVLDNLPDDGEPLDDFVNQFVYGDDDNDDDDEGYDGVMLDGAKKQKLRKGQKTVKKVNGHTIQYKAVKAVRNGKVVTVNKRVSGNIILSSKQKSSLRKARAKANTGSAIRKQMKSLGKGVDKNIYTNMKKVKQLQNASLKRHSKAIGIR
ncbi:hypothetical protein [Faucicola boevrei]|uniref:hypothetical protein n=1 Tax=Faucicola boevrei TaxID=346665 RepID=UPI000372E6E5|nr:hypothetical protein [Moraxella boevrei]